jgi:hypothetical protein
MVEFTLVGEPSTRLGESGWYATGDRDRGHILAPSLEELNFYQITSSPVESDSDMPGLAITQRCLFGLLSTHNSPRGRLTVTR